MDRESANLESCIMSTVSVPVSESLAASISAVQASLTEFHEQRVAWERDMLALLDDFEGLSIEAAMASQARDLAVEQAAVAQAADQASAESAAHEEWLMELVSQQESLSRQHAETVGELASVRSLVEQQTELLTAFISAATELTPKSSVGAGRSDPVLNSVQAEFAQLKPAAAPATNRAKNSRSGAA